MKLLLLSLKQYVYMIDSDSEEEFIEKLNYKLYVLDPLSVIIKLAILGNKPIGTKIYIANYDSNIPFL